MSLPAGSTAPDLVATTADGGRWSLRDERGHPTVLVFHRHLAWLPCQEHAAAVRDRIEEFGDAAVVVVTFTAVANLAPYQEQLAPVRVVTDEDRRGYRAFGLERAPWWRVWTPSVGRTYLRLLRQGRRLRRLEEDTLQLGGDVVVAPDGTVAWQYRSTGPDDRPPIDRLVAAVADCRPTPPRR